MALAGEPPFVLTLDVGTSSVRGLAFDAKGDAVPGAEANAGYPLETTAGGGAMLDPQRLFDVASECLRAVRDKCGDAPVAALAMDTFWHGLMGVDEHGEPATPVITWADTRPARVARRLRRRISSAEVHARTGCGLHSSYWPAKLAWLRQTEPARFRRTKRWLSFGEYFQWRLTGDLACGLSMASATGLLNLTTCDWDGPLLAELDLEPDQLAPIVDLDCRLGGEWMPAVGDGVSSSIGSGCTTAARVAVNLGTSGAMRQLWPSDSIPEIPTALWCYRAGGRRLIMGGALSEGGNVWAWLRSALRLPSVEDEEAELARMEPDGHGLTVLPFIAGERSPGWADEAGLAIGGIHLKTKPVDIVRACMEAVAYRLGAIEEQLNPAPDAAIVASGGALLRSPAWLQILADVLNRPVLALDYLEATSRGTALLALESAGLLADVEQAAFSYRAVYEPDAARYQRYREGMSRQATLYRRVVGGDSKGSPKRGRSW